MSKLPNVVIIADAPDFARDVMERWQAERNIPTFVLLSSELGDNARQVPADLAVVGAIPRTRLEAVLRWLAASGTPAACVCDHPGTLAWVRSAHPDVFALEQQDAWSDLLVRFCGEVLLRLAAEERVVRADKVAAESQHYATLGRYMVEMRHNFNNALTSLLGNAEMLLLEPAAFSAQVREQLDTIRAMALRLHGIVQRFSSLEAEMQIAEGHLGETRRPAVGIRLAGS